MDQAIHDYLKSVDVEGYWEYPPEAQLSIMFDTLIQHKTALEKITSIELKIEPRTQDASFLTSIQEVKPKADGVFSFRFSNFGNMYTLSNEAETNEEKYHVKECIEYLSANGFKHIPLSELLGLYDGVNQPFYKGLTWWTRYFDYL